MIREEIENILTKYNLPGASVSLYVDGVMETHNFGIVDDDLGEPYANDQIIRVGCIVKLLIASQIMILSQEKKVVIDEPITKYIPELKALKSSLFQNVTIRHLLNHTSGLPAILDDCGEWARTNNVLKILKKHAEDTLFLFSPGEEVSYSSTGYVILCLLIERCRGMDWRLDLKLSIFDRIGVYCHQIKVGGAIKRAPAGKKFGVQGTLDINSKNNFMSEVIPADGGALALSATDLMKFSFLFINQGRNEHGEEILSPESIDQMTLMSAVPITKTGWMKGWGMGWFTYPDGSIGFTGDGINNHALIRISPCRNKSICVVANYHSATPLFNAIWELVAKPDDIFEILHDSSELEDYQNGFDFEGKYVNGNRAYLIEKTESGYSASVGGVKASLSLVSENFYFAAALGKAPEVHFVKSIASQKKYIWNGLILFKRVD